MTTTRRGWVSTLTAVTWEAGNGSGIWVAPGSSGNEPRGNRFEGIDAAAVMLEGDDNTVEVGSAADSVMDRGDGNRVSRSPTDS